VDDKATESSLFSPINKDNEEGIISQGKKKKSVSKCLTKEREQKFPMRNHYCKFDETQRYKTQTQMKTCAFYYLCAHPSGNATTTKSYN